VQTAQGLHRNLRDTALNLSQAATEYWTEEHPLLAKPRDIADFAQQVDRLRDDVARLEQRIRNLSTR
jgi:ubiquinone biosynthesis protein UbiJ